MRLTYSTIKVNDKGKTISGLPIVWLTWALLGRGLVSLIAVSLTSKHRDYAAEYAKNRCLREDWIRTWTERREAEHIFGASMGHELLALAELVKPRKSAGRKS